MIINEYENFSVFTTEGYNDAALIKNAIKAKEYLKQYVSSDEDTEYVIIKVDDYYNVCKVTDEFQPIEICTTVAPFDKDRIYPIQKIKTEIRYLTYKEILDIPF